MPISNYISLVIILGGIFTSCHNQAKAPGDTIDSAHNQIQHMKNEKGSFGYDLNFLQSKDANLIVLKSNDGAAQVIVSAKYQGKVFTSTADGEQGKSFGWVNHPAFDKPQDPQMNAYGAEDRLWLGPEGGKFSLFFKKGEKMDFANWHTPAAIDNESWELLSADSQKASMAKDITIVNYAGTPLKMKVNRDILLLGKQEISQQLGIPVDKVKTVAFKTTNSITNSGNTAWTETTGAPCTWNLDMFMPSEKCTIVIPYIEQAIGKVATTDYFGEIPKERVTYGEGILFFKADGKSRGKLGVLPNRAKNIAGSYDGLNNILTLALFDVQNNAKYLNQEWRTDRDPYSGDAMNAYNDGPLADGKQLGPFYEIESVSPPAFLKPGEKITHHHSVFHFTGDKTALDEIARKLLGVAIEKIENAL